MYGESSCSMARRISFGVGFILNIFHRQQKAVEGPLALPLIQGSTLATCQDRRMQASVLQLGYREKLFPEELLLGGASGTSDATSNMKRYSRIFGMVQKTLCEPKTRLLVDDINKITKVRDAVLKERLIVRAL